MFILHFCSGLCILKARTFSKQFNPTGKLPNLFSINSKKGVGSPSIGLMVGGIYKLKILLVDFFVLSQSFIAKILQMAKLKGANHALLEVSSHSIVQKRIKNLAFNVFCFTNLSQDHLDYHKDMETYFRAKLSILDMLRLDTNIIVNIEKLIGPNIKGNFLK